MRDLSLHIMDIVQNSISAGATEVSVLIKTCDFDDKISIEVKDNGKGMTADMLEKVVDPFFTSRLSRKVGLGIPLLKEACERAEGELVIDSKLGLGTKIKASMKLSHSDRLPIGLPGDTFMALALGSENIGYILELNNSKTSYILNVNKFKSDIKKTGKSDMESALVIRDEIEREKINIFGGNI